MKYRAPHYKLSTPPSPEFEGHPVKWSGRGIHTLVPLIGDRVTVRMNNMGPGTIRSFFIEDGGKNYWLGVAVELDKEPDWFTKNLDRETPENLDRVGGRVALVFGTELEEESTYIGLSAGGA